MKKLAVLAMCLAVSLSGVSLAQTQGLISGVAAIDGKPVANIAVRLRSLDTGQLLGNTTASTSGQFSFTGLDVGNYVVEMVSTNGTIVGTSSSIALTPAAMTSANITLSASAASLAAAGGAGAIAAGATTTAAGTGAAAAGAAGLSTTVAAVSAVGATLGTTAVVVAANDASPSR